MTMSRRKQSHPKPIKDSCDDANDNALSVSDTTVPDTDDDECDGDLRTADLCRTHCIPSNILHLKPRNGDSPNKVDVLSISTVLCGSQFGPFDCVIVGDGCDDQCTDWTIQFQTSGDRIIEVSLEHSAGRWIRLLQLSDLRDECNLAVNLQLEPRGGKATIVCEVTKDIPAESVLVATLRVVSLEAQVKAEVVRMSDHSVMSFHPSAHMMRRSSSSESPHRQLKKEPDDSRSESATPDVVGNEADHEEDRLALINESDNAESKFVPPPLSSQKKERQVAQLSPVADADVELHRRTYSLIHVCVYCGVKFSSPRTLQAHIANYCSRKPCPVSAAVSASMPTVQFTHQQLIPVRPGSQPQNTIFPPSVSMSLGALNPLTAAAAFAAALNRLPAFQTSQAFAPPPPPVGSWPLPVVTVEHSESKSSRNTRHVDSDSGEDSVKSRKRHRQKKIDLEDEDRTGKSLRRQTSDTDSDEHRNGIAAVASRVSHPSTRNCSPLSSESPPWSAQKDRKSLPFQRHWSNGRQSDDNEDGYDDSVRQADNDDRDFDNEEIEDENGLFCVDCSIQFSSSGTYRAHRKYYCQRRGLASGGSGCRQRCRHSPSPGCLAAKPRISTTQRCHLPAHPSEPGAVVVGQLPPTPALLPMDCTPDLMHQPVTPTPTGTSGAIFLSPFFAAAAAAAAAGIRTRSSLGALMPGVATPVAIQSPQVDVRPSGTAAFQLWSSASAGVSSSPTRPESLNRSKISSEMASDEPLDLTTCRDEDVPTKTVRNNRAPTRSPTLSPTFKKTQKSRRCAEMDSESSMSTTHSSECHPNSGVLMTSPSPSGFPLLIRDVAIASPQAGVNSSVIGTGSAPPSMSRCHECNIVFYKHANYLAHKAHYCAGRHLTTAPGSSSSAMSTVTQTSPSPGAGAPSTKHTATGGSKGNRMCSPSDKTNMHQSPVGLMSTTSSTSVRWPTAQPQGGPPSPELVATLDDSGSTIQFYCIPCRIKFSSLDTLRAHKRFYCPSRLNAASTSSSSSSSVSPSSAATQQRHSPSTASRTNGDISAESHIRPYRHPGVPVVDDSASSLTTTGCHPPTPPSVLAPGAGPALPPVFQCPHCDYVAQSEIRLVDHVRAHAPSRAFRCALCGYRGNTVRGMRMHGKMHNDEASAALANAGADTRSIQPAFTDECMIEYEEPPAIPPRRGVVVPSGVSANITGSGSNAAGFVPEVVTGGVDSELIRMKNEPYKRRRSRKTYEKSEYSATPSNGTGSCSTTAPVSALPLAVVKSTCPDCGGSVNDAAEASVHACAHAAERLFRWKSFEAAAAALYAFPAAMRVVEATTGSSPPSTTLNNVDYRLGSKPSAATDTSLIAALPSSSFTIAALSVKNERQDDVSSEPEVGISTESRTTIHDNSSPRAGNDSSGRSADRCEDPSKWSSDRKRRYSCSSDEKEEVGTRSAKRSRRRRSLKDEIVDVIGDSDYAGDELEDGRKANNASSSNSGDGGRLSVGHRSSSCSRSSDEPDRQQAITKTSRLSNDDDSNEGTTSSSRVQFACRSLSIDSIAGNGGDTAAPMTTSKYCEQCDIRFMYLSTYVAHKKYYCSSHASERTETSGTAAAGVAV